MSPETLSIVVGLLGGYVGFVTGRAVSRWQRRWLQRRHERRCTALNRQWQQKIVRDVRSGKVGVCAHVCVVGAGWRDLVCPRWQATLAVSPHLAAALYLPVQNLDGIMRQAAALHCTLHGGGVQVPLAAVALAPATEVAAFVFAMQEERGHE